MTPVRNRDGTRSRSSIQIAGNGVQILAVRPPSARTTIQRFPGHKLGQNRRAAAAKATLLHLRRCRASAPTIVTRAVELSVRPPSGSAARYGASGSSIQSEPMAPLPGTPYPQPPPNAGTDTAVPGATQFPPSAAGQTRFPAPRGNTYSRGYTGERGAPEPGNNWPPASAGAPPPSQFAVRRRHQAQPPGPMPPPASVSQRALSAARQAACPTIYGVGWTWPPSSGCWRLWRSRRAHRPCTACGAA